MGFLPHFHLNLSFLVYLEILDEILRFLFLNLRSFTHSNGSLHEEDHIQGWFLFQSTTEPRQETNGRITTSSSFQKEYRVLLLIVMP